jgi:hypothetical protein
MNEQLQLYSPLPPDECARRISAAMDCERSTLFSFAALTGSHPISGRVEGSSIRLRKRIAYNNSFQTFLNATMRPEGAGTVIEGAFAMHPFTRFFMPIWFGGVILIGGFGFIISLLAAFTHSSDEQRSHLPFLLGPPGMLFFGYLLVRFGRYLARDEAAFITDFLKQTLDAHDIPSDG